MRIRIELQVNDWKPQPLFWLRYIWLVRRGGRIKDRLWVWWWKWETRRGGETCEADDSLGDRTLFKDGVCYNPTRFGEGYCHEHWGD